MNHPYVSELVASRQCDGDERSVVCIADSAQKGTDVYWCQPAGRWICVSLDALSQIATAVEVALIRLHEDVDAEEGLTLRALASDCEREAGLWLVDGDDLGQLASRYGTALEILWSSKTESVAAVHGMRAANPRLRASPRPQANEVTP